MPKRFQVTIIEHDIRCDLYLKALGIQHSSNNNRLHLDKPKNYMFTKVYRDVMLVVWSGRKPSRAEIQAEGIKPKVRPKKGTKLIKLGGFYLNETEIVRYVGFWGGTRRHETTWVLIDINGRTAYTPGSDFLFTMDGIDIFTGEPTNNDIVRTFIGNRKLQKMRQKASRKKKRNA